MATKPYKILFTIPNFDTAGSGKALLNIALRLDKKIFEPHILCMNDKGKFFEVVKSSNIPVHIFTYNLGFNAPRIAALKNTLQLARFIRKNKFDLVHSFHYLDDYYEALGCRLGGAKWIYTKKNMNWGGNAWKLRTFFANGIIAQNTDMLKKFFPKPNPNITLIPRGVNRNDYKKIELKNNLLKDEFNLPLDSKIILTVANIVPLKGIQFLIEGFKYILDDFKNTYIILVGSYDNEFAQSLIQKVKDDGLNHRILFAGKRHNINEILNCADYFVLPTTNVGEGSPVALLEAMSSGLPCIASDVYGIRDQLGNFPNQLFKESNPESLSERLKYILSLNSDEINQIIASENNLINQQYTIDIEVKKHEDFYKRILKIE